MRYLTYLPLLAVLFGLDPLCADHERDRSRFRSSRSTRHWQPSVTYPPYAQPSLNVPTLDVPSLAAPSYAQPGIGYPSYAPQPNHVEAQIYEWYLKYLGRQPRPQEIDHWVDFVFRRGTLPEAQIGIMASPECFQRCQNNPSVYVQFLLVQLTGNEPRREELHYWVTLLHQRFHGERRDFCRELINAIGQ